VAVQPSDPAVALAALDAVVVTDARRIPVREFHTMPDGDPAGHNVLRHGELITAIEIEAPAPQSAYLKIRERESYEYATVSAAACVELDGSATIRRARIALGSVAHRPWRLDDAEARLVGLRVDSDQARAAIEAAFADARPLEHNAYKIPLARNAAWRVLQTAAARVA
jgi:xanthine dehydrogenase YagS FAD-binding subunit